MSPVGPVLGGAGDVVGGAGDPLGAAGEVSWEELAAVLAALRGRRLHPDGADAGGDPNGEALTRWRHGRERLLVICRPDGDLPTGLPGNPVPASADRHRVGSGYSK
jgi:hypothetical protein